MEARRIADPELVRELDSRLPREITDIVLAEVLRQARRVAAAYKAVVKEINWDNNYLIGSDEFSYIVNLRTEIYGFGMSKTVQRCAKCGTVFWIHFDQIENFETNNIVVEYWDCRISGCRDDRLHRDVVAKVKLHERGVCVEGADYFWDAEASTLVDGDKTVSWPT